jgi:hypothetical protein
MPELKKPIWGHTDIAGAGNVYSYLHKGAARERRTKGIGGYLDRDSRALAEDLINVWTRPGQTWAEAMDATRRADEKVKGRGRKRTFAHIILSPDPKDKITLEQLRGLATAWAEEMFGYDDPAICPAQVAIVYHDDNAREIKHAHIVVNNLDLSEGGGSLQITKKQWFHATARAQELAWERGMRGFDASRESVEPKKAKRAQAKGRAQRAERSETHTMPERKMGRSRSWKQNIREAISLACNICDTPEEVIATLESAGIHCEPRRAKRVAPGSEWVFYYPQPGVPNGENKKRVSSGRLGRRFTRQGIEEQIQMSAYRRWAREDKHSEAIAAGLVDVFSVDPSVTLQELSDSMSAVNVLKVASRQEAEERRAKLLAKLDRERELGRPTERTEEHIRWLDAVVRTAAWVPDTWEDSVTAQTRRRVDVEQGKREQRRESIPLEEKVARGYRLTKEEHSFLKARKPALFREWQANRRAAEHERKRAASSRSETATRQGTSSRRASEQRSRNGESRSRSRGSDES